MIANGVDINQSKYRSVRIPVRADTNQSKSQSEQLLDEANIVRGEHCWQGIRAGIDTAFSKNRSEVILGGSDTNESKYQLEQIPIVTVFAMVGIQSIRYPLRPYQRHQITPNPSHSRS